MRARHRRRWSEAPGRNSRWLRRGRQALPSARRSCGLVARSDANVVSNAPRALELENTIDTGFGCRAGIHRLRGIPARIDAVRCEHVGVALPSPGADPIPIRFQLPVDRLPSPEPLQYAAHIFENCRMAPYSFQVSKAPLFSALFRPSTPPLQPPWAWTAWLRRRLKSAHHGT